MKSGEYWRRINCPSCSFVAIVAEDFLMAEEINEGAAYLMALRQSVHPQTTPELKPQPPSAETTSAAATVGERFEGAEKRRAPRYKCEGSAQIRDEKCDIHTWVTFSDISLHGCYVEAQATYPAGTVLHMKMEANGVRFETKGIVRVSYPYLGMGIAFAEISDENTAALKRLLATISRPTVIMGPGIASSLPAVDPLDLPTIAKPEAAVSALAEFFESRQMLMREEFVRIVKKSQGSCRFQGFKVSKKARVRPWQWGFRTENFYIPRCERGLGQRGL